MGDPQERALRRLVDDGAVAAEAFAEAVALAGRSGASLAHVLQEAHGVSRDALLSTLERAFRVPRLAPDAALLVDAASAWHPDAMERRGFVPLARDGERLTVGLVDPRDVVLRDDLARDALAAHPGLDTDRPLTVVVLTAEDVGRLLGRPAAPPLAELAARREPLSVDQGHGGPVETLTARLVQDAWERGAQALRVGQDAQGLLAEHRVEGVWRERLRAPPLMAGHVLARLQTLADPGGAIVGRTAAGHTVRLPATVRAEGGAPREALVELDQLA